jgi:molybdate transport system permease protein
VALALPAVVGFAFLLIPAVSLVIRSPWRDIGTTVTQPVALTALRLSLETATLATGIAVLFGVPMAWVLARSRIPGKSFVRAVVTLPLVLPPVVAGVALLVAFSRSGVVGRFLLEWFGVTLPFTTAGVVVAETFVAMPFLVVTVEGALRSGHRDLEEAATTLGAGRLTVFRTVTLPLIAPSLGAGAVLCWARALGEFGATITFAGNFPGTTQTLPLLVYQELETDPDTAIALSLLLMVVAIVLLTALRDRWLRVGTAA